jgi:hypothetical protein
MLILLVNRFNTLVLPLGNAGSADRPDSQSQGALFHDVDSGQTLMTGPIR